MTVLPCVFYDREFVVEPADFHNEWAFRKHVAACKQLCGDCPIQADCLDSALSADVLGVWGGTSRQERQKLRTVLGIPKPRPMVLDIPEDRDVKAT